jgi:hypothetical protein
MSAVSTQTDGHYIPFILPLTLYLCLSSRKLKCDKGSPCANCTKISRPCVFIASGLDVDAQKRLADVKEKMGILERSLEEDVARLSRSKSGDTNDARRASALPGQEEAYSDQEDDDDTRDLDPSRFVTEDAAYYDDDMNNNDDIVDLGITMGKVRITERIGGLVRPRFSEEVSDPNTVSKILLTYATIACSSSSRTPKERIRKP